MFVEFKPLLIASHVSTTCSIRVWRAQASYLGKISPNRLLAEKASVNWCHGALTERPSEKVSRLFLVKWGHRLSDVSGTCFWKKKKKQQQHTKIKAPRVFHFTSLSPGPLDAPGCLRLIPLWAPCRRWQREAAPPQPTLNEGTNGERGEEGERGHSAGRHRLDHNYQAAWITLVELKKKKKVV